MTRRESSRVLGDSAVSIRNHRCIYASLRKTLRARILSRTDSLLWQAPASLKALSYKLVVPRVSDHVRRTVPFDALKAGHARTALTWVVGLPGSGKTSLVAGWLGERMVPGKAVPCVWYRLDESDTEVAALFDAISESMRGKYTLPVWSPEHQADLSDFARRFFAEIGKERFTLVLDDAHRIADDSPLFTALEALREVAGDTLRAVVISRRAPSPLLLRGVVGGWLSVVDDLRLSTTEAQEIAHLVRGQALTKDEVRALERADGWLARVLALAHGQGALSLAFDQETRVGEFLATELLASLPKEHRATLRHLAELPEVPQDLVSSTFLPKEISRLLASLSAQRYFVDHTTQGRWRLHDLLRDALLAMNVESDSALELNRVRGELATWVRDTMPEASMQLHVTAKNTQGALDLLNVHGARWLAAGLHHTVTAWLRDLEAPKSPREEARFSLWRAQGLLPLEPEVARPLFASARRSSVLARDSDGAYTAWCGEVSSYVVQWGAVQGLADLVDELEALERELGAPEGDLAFRTSADALTALMYGRAEDQRISKYAHATARAVAHAPDVGARIGAAAQLLIYRLWWAGDFAGGRALYDTFDNEVEERTDLAALPKLLWWSCASIVDWQCGSAEVCYSKVDRGLALAESSGIHVRDFFLLTQGIFCALSEENWPRAEAYLKQLARTERTHKRLDVMVHHFFRSWHSLTRGDVQDALAHAETAWPIADAIGSMFHKVIVLSALAPARVHTGDLDGAEQAYRAQLALAKAANNPTFSFIAFCAAAEIAMARGDDVALAKQVERMLFVKHMGGFHTGCGWRTPMMQRVLAFALEKQILPDVARKWIRERHIAAPENPPPGWPMPVRILARDGLEVELDGRESPPQKAGKTPRKLRELLAILVAARSGATQSELGDWLWPDADGDRAAASLKIAVHRLRQWLGTNAIVVHDGRVALNPQAVDCDLWGGTDLATTDGDRLLHGFDLPPIEALRKKWNARSFS